MDSTTEEPTGSLRFYRNGVAQPLVTTATHSSYNFATGDWTIHGADHTGGGNTNEFTINLTPTYAVPAGYNYWGPLTVTAPCGTMGNSAASGLSQAPLAIGSTTILAAGATWCNGDIDGGGWTLLQRADSGSAVLPNNPGAYGTNDLTAPLTTTSNKDAKIADTDLRAFMLSGRKEMLWINRGENRYAILRYTTAFINGWSSGFRCALPPRPSNLAATPYARSPPTSHLWPKR